MVNIKEVVSLLKEQGCNAEIADGLHINIDDASLSTIMRINMTDLLLQNANKSAEDVATIILNMFQHHKGIDKNINREFIMSNIHVALRRPENDVTIRKQTDFADIEAYLCIYSRIGTDKQLMIKVTRTLLKKYGITEREAWSQAEKNNKEDAVIEDNEERIRKAVKDDTLLNGLKVYTVTNKTKHYGSATILDKDLLKQTLSKEKNTEWRIILVSTHYAVLIPNSTDPKIKALLQVIKKVEQSKTFTEDKLTSKTYILNL